MALPDNGLTGYVFNIQRYSLHDGPGIRTTVFLSGCPLSCGWCSNPESKYLHGALMHNAKTCLRCGRCAEACSLDAITMTPEGPAIDRDRCNLCGACVDVCPPHALKISAKQMSVVDVMAVVEPDRPFYRRSGGGVTLSGGEPLLQPEFASALLQAAKRAGINTALETAGLAPWAVLEAVIPWVDYLLYDVKHLDSEVHKIYTGVPNDIILDNLRKAAPLSRHLIARVPVIPGFNATNGEIEGIAQFVLELGYVKEMHLLPYHRHGKAKYAQLDRAYGFNDAPPLSKEREDELLDLVRNMGIECRLRG